MIKKISILMIFIFCTIIFGKKIFHNKNLLNIYSTREKEVLQDITTEFTKKTKIKVNINYGEILPLINKKNIKNNTSDIIISSNSIIMTLIANQGILQPIKINSLEQQWIPISKNPQFIVYNKNNTILNKIKNYEDLSDITWHKRIIIPKSKDINNYSLLAFIIAYNGQEYTKIWLGGIMNNLSHDPLNECDQIKELKKNKNNIAIINCNVLAKLLQEDKKMINKLKIIFPNQNNHGLHVNLSGIGLFKKAKNKNNALKFIQYITTQEGQKLYASKNNEYPINKTAPLNPMLQNWNNFKEDTSINNKLIYYAKDALEMANTFGWQ